MTLGLGVMNEFRLQRSKDLRKAFDRHVKLGCLWIMRRECLLNQFPGELNKGSRTRTRGIHEKLTFKQSLPPDRIGYIRIHIYGIVHGNLLNARRSSNLSLS